MLQGSVAKLVLEQIEGPAGFLAAAEHFPDQHPVPLSFLLERVTGSLRLAARHEPELAFDVANVFRWSLRQESAAWARLAAEPQRAALAAFEQTGNLVLEPRLMCGGLSTGIGIERPLDMIFGQTVPEDGAGMVEDDAVGLAIGRTQATADHLAE